MQQSVGFSELHVNGVGGSTVCDCVSSTTNWYTFISTALVSTPDRPPLPAPRNVLVNLGINDISIGVDTTSQATFEAEYAAILDAIHAKWPAARVYASLVWARDTALWPPTGIKPFPTAAGVDTVDSWITNAVASRSSFASIGDDERVWLKGSDDGATNTTDGMHYSAAGQAAAVAAKRNAVWP